MGDMGTCRGNGPPRARRDRSEASSGPLSCRRKHDTSQHQTKEGLMSYPAAIVIGAGLIAGALMFSGQGNSQTPQPVGRWAIAASGNQVWRIDTATGLLDVCEGAQ